MIQIVETAPITLSVAYGELSVEESLKLCASEFPVLNNTAEARQQWRKLLECNDQYELVFDQQLYADKARLLNKGWQVRVNSPISKEEADYLVANSCVWVVELRLEQLRQQQLPVVETEAVAPGADRTAISSLPRATQVSLARCGMYAMLSVAVLYAHFPLATPVLLIAALLEFRQHSWWAVVAATLSGLVVFASFGH